jgi:hypothetical protein
VRAGAGAEGEGELPGEVYSGVPAEREFVGVELFPFALNVFTGCVVREVSAIGSTKFF